MSQTSTGAGKRKLRKKTVCDRYGGITPRCLELKVKKGLLPAPEYPLGPKLPLWDEGVLDEHDRAAALAAKEQSTA